MRTEQEMLALILNTARGDARIRAVLLEGSRTDPNAKRDRYQDFDVAYIVRETESFQRDRGWIDRFGPRLFMQYPEEGDAAASRAACYGWLMQLADGNRLDLHVMTAGHALAQDFRESLCQVLLDKDGLLPPHAPSSDRDHWVRRPEEREFLAACNEFWWCLDNVAKGLARQEPSYVQEMLAGALRPQLQKLLCWKAGAAHGWQVSPGKAGKRLPLLLPAEDWQGYLDSYFGCALPEMWDGCRCMALFFDRTARGLARELGFCYNEAEAAGSLGWLRRVEEEN